MVAFPEAATRDETAFKVEIKAVQHLGYSLSSENK